MIRPVRATVAPYALDLFVLMVPCADRARGRVPPRNNQPHLNILVLAVPEDAIGVAEAGAGAAVYTPL